ncbi:protein FAM160B1-like isoform X2 [Contarinia nasturtii]|uniref:protein FAM160B1-like isoform X2 n=1 Tax=Contarinia nasturtii TaxID=265458 RepID=UPI0012D378C9|nr:protein FAM160B1-like isoform X2 [Contarinia nasturtii]
MLGRFNEALQTAAEVLAPPPTPLQNLEYHWKHVKNFYAENKIMPKVHIENTNLTVHLEEMLKLIIEEDCKINEDVQITNCELSTPFKSMCSGSYVSKECFDFVLTNRPLDLLVDICRLDSPIGATGCVLPWMRRFLTCLQQPRLDHKSILQPIQKLIAYCSSAAGHASPYEQEEIVFLLNVAGVIRKEPLLLHLFLPAHEHSWAVASLNPLLGMRAPVKNPLFEHAKLESQVRQVSLLQDRTIDTSEQDETDKAVQEPSKLNMQDYTDIGCDCTENDSFILLNTVLRYIDSADSVVVVRACEAALILMSLPSIGIKCNAQKSSFHMFAKQLSQKLAFLCQEIPEDMDTGEIEDCVSYWGLLPRDSEAQYFIGKPQLMEFLCWLDYANRVAKECGVSEIVQHLAENFRVNLFELSIEPMISILDTSIVGFMLVLMAKIIRQTDAPIFNDQLATWLVGSPIVVDGDDLAVSTIENTPTINHTDCLLNIIIENAQDNQDILLPTLQFVEALLDNPNARILHNMLFRYLETRGYYDRNAVSTIQTWSDEEDEREKHRSSASEAIKSVTLKPNNILKVINNFLLLLPRQIISDSIGTCYEEYVQDANRHYKNWIAKTSQFDWPIEAVCRSKEDDYDLQSPESPPPILLPTAPACKLHSCDSGIAVEQFYEGPLLRLLFLHVKDMAKFPYELNIAVIAILSKLSFFPHPYLHEILLNPELPVARSTNTLWNSMQTLARHLLLEIPRIEGFQKRITETAKRLLINPPIMSESYEDHDHLFESLVALEEFCKELAAIAFVKYHHATE